MGVEAEETTGPLGETDLAVWKDTGQAVAVGVAGLAGAETGYALVRRTSVEREQAVAILARATNVLGGA